MKDVLRSTVMDNGGQYVVVDLVQLMLTLSVNNLDMIPILIIVYHSCKDLAINTVLLISLFRSGNSHQPIWSANMNSASSDMCFGRSNICPATSVTSCTHSSDVAVECS